VRKNIRKTEIIAIASGKGGTGKTLISACLGYSLANAGHKVLMIDADPGTDGLSLYMLGSEGREQISEFKPLNTFCGILEGFKNGNQDQIKYFPHTINRKKDYKFLYNALISGRSIYGGDDVENIEEVIPRLDRQSFQKAIGLLFNSIHEDNEFDYVIVDTRGGFGFESSDICALSDSFIIVTEADYTSFYQDRSLVKWTNEAADDLDKNPVLRAIIINKAIRKDENDFRLALEREFPIRYIDTFPIPLCVEVIEEYRQQRMPYYSLKGSIFSAYTLNAFSIIMHLVTAGWAEDRIDRWNNLVIDVEKKHKSKMSFASKTKKSLKFILVLIVVFALGLATPKVAGSIKSLFNILGDRDKHAKVYDRNETNFARKNIFLELYEKGNLTFDGIDLSGFDLRDMNLANVRLRRANLSYAEMVAINLRGADLEGADLRKANLNSADLREANLSGANLSGAELNLASLKNAILDSADLRGANLFQSDVSEEQMDAAILDEFTILPNEPR
jgi:MinD-like ATPase involved in chromosome partitioning or flagellar assembly